MACCFAAAELRRSVPVDGGPPLAGGLALALLATIAFLVRRGSGGKAREADEAHFAAYREPFTSMEEMELMQHQGPVE
eukprot:CAMPEP_0204528084 /NCGR_PEP_ID=MMETSP0661-20131031/9331_1 /ASSEMBLY_ACC=CAM_ASM_000606 /TAXON_ID=109239 /ORGANISM="Alexandrium margalefi, Strain AMGDE01CS-322" /LENGTH=77 /DNA_ID=CAMNT_0051534037 /DNA_START=14 /DNA_END=248 /DNA_ORIENTATION=+